MIIPTPTIAARHHRSSFRPIPWLAIALLLPILCAAPFLAPPALAGMDSWNAQPPEYTYEPLTTGFTLGLLRDNPPIHADDMHLFGSACNRGITNHYFQWAYDSSKHSPADYLAPGMWAFYCWTNDEDTVTTYDAEGNPTVLQYSDFSFPSWANTTMQTDAPGKYAMHCYFDDDIYTWPPFAPDALEVPATEDGSNSGVRVNGNKDAFVHTAGIWLYSVDVTPKITHMGVGQTVQFSAAVTPNDIPGTIVWLKSSGMVFVDANGNELPESPAPTGATVRAKCINWGTNLWVKAQFTPTNIDCKGERPVAVSIPVGFVGMHIDLKFESGGAELGVGRTGSYTRPDPLGHYDEEEGEGGYLLLNWDDDNNNGVPDKDDSSVAYEDNLGRITWDIFPPELAAGLLGPVTISLDKGSLGAYLGSGKGDTPPVYSWTLPIPVSEIFLEGRQTSASEKDVTIRASLDASAGHMEDIVKVTVVDIALGSGVYRELGFANNNHGHAGLLYKYLGNCTRASLKNSSNTLVLEATAEDENSNEINGVRTVSLNTGYLVKRNEFGLLCEYWGVYNTDSPSGNPNYTNRIKILRNANNLHSRNYTVEDNDLEYGVANALLTRFAVTNMQWPQNPTYNNIASLRCDGLVEYCYEEADIDLWAMYRDHSGGNGSDQCNYDIVDVTDLWDYNAFTGDWDIRLEGNNRSDNLEEHNDADFVFYSDVLMPATQSGHTTPSSGNDTEMHLQTAYPLGMRPIIN